MSRIPKRYLDLNGQLIVKPYGMKDLCAIYETPYATLRNWLDELQDDLGIRKGHRYTIQQVAIIFERLGVPKTIHVHATEKDFD